MKKIISILLVLVLVFSLCACGAAQQAPAAAEKVEEAAAEVEAAVEEAVEEAAEEVAEAAPDYASMSIDELKAVLQTVTGGKLTVATSPDFAPYEFYALDEAGNPSLAGFDVALAGYIADFLGLELEIIPMDFDGVLLEIANGSVDIGLAGLSPDPARMDAMDFSDIYYYGGQSFCTCAGKEDLFPTLEASNDAKFSIGAQTGSIQMDLAEKNSPNADIVAVTKVTDIIAMLLNDKLDGAYIETAVAQTYAINYPDLIVLHDVEYLEAEGSAVGIAKGNPALVAAINLAIAAGLADGTIDGFVAEANELAAGDVYEGLLEDMA